MIELSRVYIAVMVLLLISDHTAANLGVVSENVRIESESLGYVLQYRVYTPPGYDTFSNLPTIYITDGQWYLSAGHMDTVLDEEIARGTIDPVVAIFLDNRNPDNLQENRRNKPIFLCY